MNELEQVKQENEDLHSYVEFLQIRLMGAKFSKWKSNLVCLGLGVSIGVVLMLIFG